MVAVGFQVTAHGSVSDLRNMTYYDLTEASYVSLPTGSNPVMLTARSFSGLSMSELCIFLT